MIINDINARVIEEFSRISTANTPSVDDGGGVFLSTVLPANVLNYWKPYDSISGHPCLMVIPFKRSYMPRLADASYMEVTLTFSIHGVVKAETGLTDGRPSASVLCENLITDCIRTARVLFKSDMLLQNGTRFKIAKIQPIDTQPIRLDENRYCFYFDLALSTFPVDVI